MGYVKKQIRELTKSAGSNRAARKAAEKWFNDGVSNKSVKEAAYVRNRFEPGKIYIFEYDPITPDLEFFDKNPVVLALEQLDNNNDLGVNLNLLPIRVKEDLLDDLYSRVQGQIKSNSTGVKYYNAKTQGGLRITYDGMKSYLQRSGCDFAIRQYKPSRKQKQAVVSYSKWPEIALCDFIDLNGVTMKQIRRLFSKK